MHTVIWGCGHGEILPMRPYVLRVVASNDAAPWHMHILTFMREVAMPGAGVEALPVPYRELHLQDHIYNDQAPLFLCPQCREARLLSDRLREAMEGKERSDAWVEADRMWEMEETARAEWAGGFSDR